MHTLSVCICVCASWEISKVQTFCQHNEAIKTKNSVVKITIFDCDGHLFESSFSDICMLAEIYSDNFLSIFGLRCKIAATLVLHEANIHRWRFNSKIRTNRNKLQRTTKKIEILTDLVRNAEN
jgi:hypothetical protein